MDYINIQAGGYPGTAKTFNFLHNAYASAISALTAFGGTTYILSGVELAGGNVSAGHIVYNNEVLPFEACAEHARVCIVQLDELQAYNQDANSDGNLDLKSGNITRKAVCGTGLPNSVAEFDFSELKPAFYNFLGKYLSNVILPYTGSLANMPVGFQLCDGTNGTPDMKGAFVVGYNPDDEDYNTIGKQGGTKTVTLTEAQMPQHNHDGNTNSAGTHNHTYTTENSRGSGVPGAEDGQGGMDVKTTNSAGAHTHTLTTNNKGGSQPHENRPPYFTVAYMMFVG